MIASFQKLYCQGGTREHRPITCNILLPLISKFEPTIFEGASLPVAFRLAFAEFWRIEEFTYDKVEYDFNSWNSTRGSLSF